MLHKNISIQKEEIMLTWKDLIIAFLFSLLLSITLYASNILKEFNFLIISIVFLISIIGYIIVFAILKSQYDKKHIGTLKQTLKILYPFFIKMENSYNIEDYNIFKGKVIQLIPNNTEEKQILKNISKKENIDFSLTIVKIFSALFEYSVVILIYFAFALCFAIANGKIEEVKLLNIDNNSLFVFLFVFSFLQKILENNIEKNKLFKIQDANAIKRMCNMIIEILEEELNTKNNKKHKICSKMFYNKNKKTIIRSTIKKSQFRKN